MENKVFDYISFKIWEKKKDMHSMMSHHQNIIVDENKGFDDW